MKGIKSRTKLYDVLYAVFTPFYFMLKHFKGFVTNTEILGKAIINTAARGYEKVILESVDINKVANNY